MSVKIRKWWLPGNSPGSAIEKFPELMKVWRDPYGRPIYNAGKRAMSEREKQLRAERTAEQHRKKQLAAAAKGVESEMKRGRVNKAQSQQSKHRMMSCFASYISLFGANREERRAAEHSRIRVGPVSVIGAVITYGDNHPNCDDSKTDIDTLAKRQRRKWGEGWMLWRLENQTLRQAPHYNITLAIPGWHSYEQMSEWLTKAWLEITGTGGSPLSAREERGVVTTEIYNAIGWANYMAKDLDKKAQTEFVSDHPGRWWGMTNRAAAAEFYRDGICQWLTEEMQERLRWLNIFYKAGGTIEVATHKGPQWWKMMRTRWSGRATEWIMTGNPQAQQAIRASREAREKRAQEHAPMSLMESLAG